MQRIIRRRALLILLLVASAWSCVGLDDLEPPPDGAILGALEAVLGQGRGEAQELPLAVFVSPISEPAFYRAANADERARLWLPEPMEGFEIEAMRSKSYPAWRILFYNLLDGERGAAWAATVVEVEGRLCLVLRSRPAVRLEDGSLRPDVRPDVGRGDMAAAGETLMMPVLPAWDLE